MPLSQHRKSILTAGLPERVTVDNAANDNYPLPRPTATGLAVHALLAWIATVIFGGTALAMGIEFTAKAFETPAFAELRHMGFIMAGVVGIGFAAAAVIAAIRNPNP